MSLNQRIILYTFLTVFFLAGCSQNRHAAPEWKSLLSDFPEHIYMCPTVNAFKYSKVGVFRFSEPSYAMGTGKAAAEAIFDDLLKKGGFFQVINETIQEYMGTETRLEFARSKGYDLIITGDVLYYFDGSDLEPSVVQERIRVTHVPSNRILWSATAECLSRPEPSRDFLLFQTNGEPARPATWLVKENALKFSNMLLKQPKQKSSAAYDVTIPLSSHEKAMEGIQVRANALASQNTVLEQQLREEIEAGECLKQEVDNLSAQTDQLERQLKEEIERGDVTLKRDQGKNHCQYR